MLLSIQDLRKRADKDHYPEGGGALIGEFPRPVKHDSIQPFQGGRVVSQADKLERIWRRMEGLSLLTCVQVK